MRETYKGSEWGGDMFASVRSKNTDGTLTPLPTASQIISTSLHCDICGIQVEEKTDLVKRNGMNVCDECITG